MSFDPSPSHTLHTHHHTHKFNFKKNHSVNARVDHLRAQEKHCFPAPSQLRIFQNTCHTHSLTLKACSARCYRENSLILPCLAWHSAKVPPTTWFKFHFLVNRVLLEHSHTPWCMHHLRLHSSYGSNVPGSCERQYDPQSLQSCQALHKKGLLAWS